MGYRKYTTERQRRDVVERWRASGLSQAEFCRRDEIPQWALSQWKREVERSSRTAEQLVPSKNRPKGRQRKRRTPSELEQYWKGMVAEQSVSGLSAVQFCKRRGISLVSFKQWHGEFVKRDYIDSLSLVNPRPQSNPFVAVRIDGAQADASVEAALEIVLPGGSKIRVTAQTPLELLSKVLAALEAKC